MEEKLTKKVGIHPHSIIAEFVNQYEMMIKPALEDGNLAGASAVIGMAAMKYDIVENSLGQLKDGAYAPYRMAMIYLGGLLRNEPSKPLLDDILMCADRQMAELQLIMQGDEIYDSVLKSNQLG